MWDQFANWCRTIEKPKPKPKIYRYLALRHISSISTTMAYYKYNWLLLLESDKNYMMPPTCMTKLNSTFTSDDQNIYNTESELNSVSTSDDNNINNTVKLPSTQNIGWPVGSTNLSKCDLNKRILQAKIMLQLNLKSWQEEQNRKTKE